MENDHHSLNYYAMMHGLYLGLALILNLLTFYIIGNPFSDVSGFLSYAIIISGIGFAMWTYAKLNTDEGLPYSRALGLGTLVVVFGAALFAFFTFVLYKYIEPGLLDKLLAVMEAKFLEQGLSDDMTEKILSAQKNVMTPGILAFGQLFTLTLLGFIFSLILAIFFKKEPADPFFGVEREEEEED